ncbi:leucine-rich repeat protein, partial [Prevotella sp. P6B4]|uniref:leucine-rich repeat protein n=1 Tax=Prevotella sp. P6B4 TaxID=1410614 RepID=UPI0012DD3F10
NDIGAWCNVVFSGSYSNPLEFARHLYSDENTEITDLVIPNGVTTIGNYAFAGSEGFTSVTIPSSVTSIGENAFQGCSGLTSIVVESENSKYDSRDNCNAIIETVTNKLIAGCNNTTIPSSVTSICDYAFYRCDGLVSITIPDNLTSIGDYAFSGCSGLTSVTVLNPLPVDITKDVFTNRANATLYVPTGSKEKYKTAEYWKQFKIINSNEPYAILSDNNTVLTFYYDYQKETRDGMDIGPFVGKPDFQNWYAQKESITKVVFDDSFANYTSLISTAFWFFGCNNLATITGIENLNTDNVIKMNDMFTSCSSLKSLDLSGFKTENVTDMSGMFSGCSGLTSLDLSGFKTENVTDMSWIFYGCSSLTNLDLSGFKTDKVTDMTEMFWGCSGLTKLDLSG